MATILESNGFFRRLLPGLLIFLVISAAYLYAFPQATIFYAGVVLLHALAGTAATVLILWSLLRWLRSGSVVARAAGC